MAGDPAMADWARASDRAQKFGHPRFLRSMLSPEAAVQKLRTTPSSRPHVEAAIVGGCYWGAKRTGDPRGRLNLYKAHLAHLKVDTAAIDKAGTANQALHTAWSESDPQSEFKFTIAEFGGDGVSRVGAKGTRTGDDFRSFRSYVEISDPRHWHDKRQSVEGNPFKTTYCTGGNLRGALSDPPRLAGTNPGWNGQLFEVVSLELPPGDELTEFRNILNIDFRVDGKTQIPSWGPEETEDAGHELSLEYSLRESLSTTVLGILNLGGIDVDSGHGGVEISLQRGQRRTVTSTARKDVRFSKACAFSELMNLSVFPFLLFWIPTFISTALDPRRAEGP
jgi:hypothetical protein